MTLVVMHGYTTKKYDGIDIVLKGKTKGITINIVHHFNR